MPCLSECSSPSLPSSYMGNFHTFKSPIASIVWVCFLHVCVLVIIKCFFHTKSLAWFTGHHCCSQYKLTQGLFLHQCRWCKFFHLSINTSTAEYLFSKAAYLQQSSWLLTLGEEPGHMLQTNWIFWANAPSPLLPQSSAQKGEGGYFLEFTVIVYCCYM